MLRVDVVYVPCGDRSREEVLGSVNIANVSGLAAVSDYAVWQEGGILRAGVSGHHRADGWLPLVRRAFAALMGDVNP